jgi:NAD(P)H-hydrate epimerase
MPLGWEPYRPRRISQQKDEAPQIPSEDIVFAELVGRSHAIQALQRFRDGDIARVRIYAAPGHTGAAALVCARHLHNQRVPVLVYLAGSKMRLRPIAEKQYNAYRELGGGSVDLRNVDEALGTLVTLADDELVIDAMEETFVGERTSGEVGRMCAAIASALQQRDPLGIMELVFDRKYRPPRPRKSEATMDSPAGHVGRRESRMLDSVAAERFHIDGLALMENAGYRAAREAYLMLDNPSNEAVLIVCGKGNNGGDGFCMARYLGWWGVRVAVVLLGQAGQVIDDARVNLNLMGLADVEFMECEPAEGPEVLGDVAPKVNVIADAILGTGLDRDLRAEYIEIVNLLNSAGKPILAIDIPTGLDCDTGLPLGASIKATRTITFGAPKQAFILEDSWELIGEVIVADISLPPMLLPGYVSPDDDDDYLFWTDDQQAGGEQADTEPPQDESTEEADAGEAEGSDDEAEPEAQEADEEDEANED